MKFDLNYFQNDDFENTYTLFFINIPYIQKKNTNLYIYK